MYMADEFDRSTVMNRVNNIADEIAEEQEKPENERNREKELKLIQKQLMEGLKLSTGYWL